MDHLETYLQYNASPPPPNKLHRGHGTVYPYIYFAAYHFTGWSSFGVRPWQRHEIRHERRSVATLAFLALVRCCRLCRIAANARHRRDPGGRGGNGSGNGSDNGDDTRRNVDAKHGSVTEDDEDHEAGS